jgi:hypothetical protein
MVITLLVAVSALLLAMIGSVLLDPRSRSDRQTDDSEEWPWMMKANPFF